MKIFALNNPALNSDMGGLTGTGFLNRALPFLFTWLIIVGVLFFLIQFILGGLKWIQSQGDKSKIEEAQKQLTFAFVGLLVTFSVFMVTKVIGLAFGITGLENLQISLPTL